MKSCIKFSRTIDELLSKNLPFACWFAPKSDVPHCIIATERKSIKYCSSATELSGREGFVIAPFTAEKKTPLVVLAPEIFLRGFAEIENFSGSALPNFPAHSEHSEKSCPEEDPAVITQFPEYTACINRAVEAIGKEEFSKVVLSRCISRKRQGESLGRLLFALQESAPQVFVYLVNIPSVGLWMGATPETLLSVAGDTATTVSLAGTQRLRPDGKYCWFAKEIEEQAFVSRYAVDILNRYGIASYKTKGPENLETTAVAHLKTTFTFPIKNIADKLGSFAGDLAPTPAVCGLPKEEARRFILENEPHSRKYYGGFLGAWNLAECPTHLFVNLRCMEVRQEEYILYTGGGITVKSSADDEWEETNHKAQTLLRVIDELQAEEGRL